MKYLIVGLGNVGPEYEQTRHNIGFSIIDQIAEKFEWKTFKNETNLEEWVESKITKAHDYLSAVLNYLKGRMADAEEEDEMGGEGVEDMEMSDEDEDMLEEG